MIYDFISNFIHLYSLINPPLNVLKKNNKVCVQSIIVTSNAIRQII